MPILTCFNLGRAREAPQGGRCLLLAAGADSVLGLLPTIQEPDKVVENLPLIRREPPLKETDKRKT